MSSIRLRLLKWLIAPILLLNLAGGALTYMLAWLPAQLAFDQGLADAAGALGARLSAHDGADADAAGGSDRPPLALRIDLPPQAEQVLRSGDSDAVYFTVRDGAGRAIAGDADFPPLPAAARSAPAGAPYVAYDAAVRGEAVRVVALSVGVAAFPARTGAPAGAKDHAGVPAPAQVRNGTPVRAGAQAYIAVAKTLRKRTAIRQAVVRALILLETLFALACVGLIWFSVGNGLLPLSRLRAGLDARGGDDLAPIAATDVPYELEPVVSAFNGLLDKVADGARARHAFLADVAHQLRTPLAGLRTQLEWLGARHSEPETAQSLRLMLSATERMTRQTNQLLALARAEPRHFEKTRLEALALDALVEEAIQSFVDQATLKAIDIGFDLAPVTILGDRFLLRDLIDNLIDNAIRYTPAGGAVTVACRDEGGCGVLAVEDTGPGIPAARREQVFNRYVRLDDKTSGSGLGLAIVRDIAVVHGAALGIADGAGGHGALFTVRFPGPG